MCSVNKSNPEVDSDRCSGDKETDSVKIPSAATNRTSISRVSGRRHDSMGSKIDESELHLPRNKTDPLSVCQTNLL